MTLLCCKIQEQTDQYISLLKIVVHNKLNIAKHVQWVVPHCLFSFLLDIKAVL